MPSIDKRIGKNGNITYRARVRMRGVPQQTKTFKTKVEAKAWGQKIENAIREGKQFPSNQSRKRTLKELIDKYIGEFLPRKANKTLKKQIMQLQWWNSQIGGYLLSEVTPHLIGEQRDKLLDGITRRHKKRSPGTTNRYLAILSSAYTTACKEWHWVDVNPVKQISRPRESKARDRYLSTEEIAAFLNACKESHNPHLHTIVKLAICLGTRRNELLYLKWTDINFEERKIFIRDTKNSESHVLPMSDIVLEILKQHRDQGKQSIYLFPGKSLMKPADITGAWKFAVERAKLVNFTFHDLRRTCGTLLADNGESALVIARVLNHKCLAVTQKYCLHSDASVQQTLNKMNNQIFGEFHE